MYCINGLTPAFFNRTGTGAEETIAHGQNAIPAIVQVVTRQDTITWTAGVHTKDAVLVTVQINQKYDLIVWFKK